VTVYRYPPPLRSEEAVILEEIQTLTDSALPIPAQVTGASASPTGDLVAIRTYQDLTFFRMQNGTLKRLEGGAVNLRTLNESQGEAVGLGPEGRVALTSEGGNFGRGATMRLMRCRPRTR
jgi:hypothetical protein